MNLIAKITDENLELIFNNMINPNIRIGARGIILRDDGKIAVFNKRRKNEYKLPGGGVEENETPELAFKREVLEETGCKIEIIKELGITEEYKSLTNFKQISHIFFGKVIEDVHKLNLTQKETDEGAELIWEFPKNALKLISSSYNILVGSKDESVYQTKFIILRDEAILKFYIKENNNY